MSLTPSFMTTVSSALHSEVNPCKTYSDQTHLSGSSQS